MTSDDSPTHRDAIKSLRIVEQDGQTIEAEIDLDLGVVTVITNIRLDDELLMLYGLHVDGPGAGVIGPGRLRQIVDKVMEMYDVAAIEIHGFRRTTGAFPGRVPRPIRFVRR